MASIAVCSAVVTLASALTSSATTSSSGFVSVKAVARVKSGALERKSKFESKTSSNGIRVSCMQVWSPYNNLKFETLSYLPPLSNVSLAKQIDYVISRGWIPCIEFDVQGVVARENSNMPGYYDGRYWTLWKLPMFGCTDSGSVLSEIEACKAVYGANCYIRCLGFDNIKQVQCASFIVHKPSS